jgi:hypothetical protein
VVDNIITNSILPQLLRNILNRTMEGTEIQAATISMQDGEMKFDVA